MGYYDGIGGTTFQASAWEIADITETPVILVVDGKGSSLSVAAQIHGFLTFRPDSRIEGVILNRTSPEMVKRLKPQLEALGISCIGAVPVCEEAKLESRHLGLTIPQEQEALRERLEALGVRVYRHYSIDGYPSNITKIVSDEGYGKNEYIETEHSLVVVTAPGPGSGKMAVCLSQLYHENKRGIKAGYAKFETFPIWNVPLQHPVNLAYEAATVDLNDMNMIDPFHLEAYGETTVNYNRDVEVFPVLNAMFEKIYGESPYKSPTDMGVNMVGNCIVDDEAVKDASRNEIIRRYYKALCEQRKGNGGEESIYKLELLMKQAGTGVDNRPVAAAAMKRAEETGAPAAAIELPDGAIVTGKTSSLLGASSAMLLNALKKLANLDHDVKLISPTIIEPIQHLKVSHLGNHNPRLHTDEILIALCICAATDEKAELAMQQLEKLKCCEVHSSVILSGVDENVFQKLGVNLTCEPIYQTKKLFHG